VKLNKISILFFLIVVYACKSLTVENPSQKLAEFLTQTYLSEGDLRAIESDERRFQYQDVDLNEDGNKEYVVFLSTRYFCGSGGCSFLILDSNVKLIADFSVTTPPIYVDSQSTGGWKNLILWSDGSYHKLIYNTTLRSYPENLTVEPEIDLDIQSKQGFQVIFKTPSTQKVYTF